MANATLDDRLAKLTERQLHVYNFIVEHIETVGFPPALREIGEALGIRSPNGVMCHLRALESKGLIERDETTARGIRLLDIEKVDALELLDVLWENVSFNGIGVAVGVPDDEMLTGTFSIKASDVKRIRKLLEK